MTDAELHREEWIAERAGILEFDAGLPRNIAERLAVQFWRTSQREQGTP